MRLPIATPLVVVLALIATAVLTAADKKQAFKSITPENVSAKWWADRHTQKLKALKSQPVDLLRIGDSITHGWEGRGKKVWQEYYAKRNAFNIGYSGDRTEHVIWRLQHGEIDNISPRLAVVMS